MNNNFTLGHDRPTTRKPVATRDDVVIPVADAASAPETAQLAKSMEDLNAKFDRFLEMLAKGAVQEADSKEEDGEDKEDSPDTDTAARVAQLSAKFDKLIDLLEKKAAKSKGAAKDAAIPAYPGAAYASREARICAEAKAAYDARNPHKQRGAAM